MISHLISNDGIKWHSQYVDPTEGTVLGDATAEDIAVAAKSTLLENFMVERKQRKF